MPLISEPSIIWKLARALDCHSITISANYEKYTLAELNNPQMADRAKRFLPKMKTLDFDQPSSLFVALKSGQAHAMQIDTPIIDWYAANNPGFHELPELLSSVQNNAIFI